VYCRVLLLNTAV